MLQNIYDFLFDLLTRRRALKFSLLYEGHLGIRNVKHLCAASEDYQGHLGIQALGHWDLGLVKHPV